MRRIATVCAAVLACASVVPPAWGQALVASSLVGELAPSRVITVPKDKSVAFRLLGAAGEIVVAQPDVAEIVANTDRSVYVRGKSLGTTNILVYDANHRLLEVIDADAIRRGSPIHLEPRATWTGDQTHAAFVAWLWVGPRRSLRLAVVNLGRTTGRCFVPLSLPDISGRSIVFEDLLSHARYVRDGDDLLVRGLYLEMPPDGYHVFRIRGHAPRERQA